MDVFVARFRSNVDRQFVKADGRRFGNRVAVGQPLARGPYPSLLVSKDDSPPFMQKVEPAVPGSEPQPSGNGLPLGDHMGAHEQVAQSLDEPIGRLAAGSRVGATNAPFVENDKERLARSPHTQAHASGRRAVHPLNTAAVRGSLAHIEAMRIRLAASRVARGDAMAT